MISILNSIIDPSHIRLNLDEDLADKSLGILAPLFIHQDGALLLLNENKIIISCYQMNKSLNNYLGAKVTLDMSKVDGIIHNISFKDNKIDQPGILYYQICNIGKHKQYLCLLLPSEVQDQEIKKWFQTIRDVYVKTYQFAKQQMDNHNFLLNCLDSLDEGISIINEENTIVYANKSCLSFLGIAKEDLLYKPIGLYSKSKPLLEKVLESKKSIIDIEYNLRFRDRTIHLVNSGYPVFDSNNQIIGAIDIHKNLERNICRQNSISGYGAYIEFEDIIGESRALKDCIKLAKAYAENNENILIMGESGTGKDLFAQAIHNHSNRRSEPFIAVNCANFPKDLIESELFGYEEGAFTGALKGGRQGKFELANKGTLFLDELAELPLNLQSKLLRAVETKTITRVGGNKPIKLNVRLIAATNGDLLKMVGMGEFRKDLYYRMKVLSLNLPPLRDRKEDIFKITDYFINKRNNETGKSIVGLDKEAKITFANYQWPGNIRELQNTIVRGHLLCSGSYISIDDIDIHSNFTKEAKNKSSVIRVNKKIILDTLNMTGGNKKKAAEILGISRPTIYKALKNKSFKE